MGKPGARKMDPIVSATPGDVHIIMIPSPGGPVPTPIPHPCVSMIKDKVAKKVKVMGQPGAVKGSKSKHAPPHIPMGPGPFQKPPKNEGEIITGSANVFYEGKAAAMMGDTGQMCSDPSDTPVGKVIGTAATVLVGGGGAGSDEAREKASADAMKAAATACHKWISANMPPGAEREQAHRDLCTATGHPIDVATGKVFTQSIDLELPGRIGFKFARNYSSARAESGPFGWGWRHSYQLELIITEEFVAHRDANGRFLSFPPIRAGERVANLTGGMVLRRTADEYTVEEPSGAVQRFHCTVQGAVVFPVAVIEDRFGNRLLFDYQDKRLIRVTDSAGRKIKVQYNDEGSARSLLLENAAGEDDVVRTYHYNEAHELWQVRDRFKQAFTYEYADRLLVREIDRNGFSFYFRYDANRWCSETWGDGGILYRGLEYDRANNRTRVCNSEGNVTVYLWDEHGLVSAEIDSLGRRWAFQYDEHQHKTSIADPLGNQWSYDYDESGRLVSRTDPEGNVVAIAYDDEGRRASYVDAHSQEWLIRYSSGEISTLLDPDSNEAAVSWSDRGDLLTSKDELGRITRYAYDSSGNLVERHSKHGVVVGRGYTFEGRLLHETDSLGPRVRFEYDLLGRVTAEHWRDHGDFSYELDPEGNITQVTDSFGAITRFQYGRFNKILLRVTPDGQETRLEYDSENRLKAIVYPGNRRAENGYDEDGRIAWKRTTDGRTVNFVRDAAGFVSEAHDDAGLVAIYTRDGLGRVVKRVTADGQESTFEYDPGGRLIRAVNESADCAMEYDPCGRVVAESSAHGSLVHQFDAAGRHIRTATDDLMCAIQREDTAITFDVGVGSVLADYDIHGRLTALDFSNGHKEKFYYQASRKPEMAVRAQGSTRYLYDLAGALTASECSGRPKLTFERDSLRRLTSISTGGPNSEVTTRFLYDSQGNRSRGDGGFRFGAGNRLEATGRELLRYDLRGRLVERCSVDGVLTKYRYSCDNFLVELERDGLRVNFRYDALGRRISKTVNGAETRFLWEGSRLAREFRPNGEERHYIYRPDSYVPLLCLRREREAAWEALFFHNDHRGCPEALTDSKGREVWRAQIGPFGETEAQEGVIDQPLALPGQYRDVETGLVYNYHRYFDPGLTIFITPDPLGHLAGEQLYAYAPDPITRIDPLGLSSDDYDQSKKTPHRIVEINGVKHVEFEASTGFTSQSNINYGGSGVGADGSPDAMASIGPNGEVVVMEGRHRAVAAAAGDPIPEHLGGIPGKPGHLRYPLGEEGNFETTDHVGPSLGDLASDPAKLDAARSGHPSRRTT